jgi:signal-transduction protein with cAMP-binding, CBS, and nucleotidyltransferase domain
MIGAATVRALFALRGVEPFGRLDDLELLLIARHARLRAYPSGRVILAGGQVADHLFVTVEGEAETGGGGAPAVFDAPGLLFGLAARADYLAGPQGLSALVIAKPHVFTIARECPEFVVGLRDLAPPP